MRTRIAAAWLVLAFLRAGTTLAQTPVEVEPAELARRADLIGKEIVVDDRVKLFYPHPGRGIDEIHLKRTPVIFRLTERLRYSQAPSARSVRVQGILRKEGDGLVCDVTELPQLYVDDLRRLDLEAARLKPDDLAGRIRLAEWATRRGNVFRDDALLARGEALASEAFAIEQNRAESSPDALLMLARRARDRKLPEPQPSSLAHRAFLVELKAARTVAAFDRIADAIVAFFPAVKTGAATAASSLPAEYERDPGGFYRNADAPVRASLDRRLWTEAVAGSLRLRAAKSPAEGRDLAEQAKARIPDRPEVVNELRSIGFEAMARDPTRLREEELLDLAKFFREEKKEPATATAKIRAWLDDQRERFSPVDADGRIALARQYVRLLNDKASAADLLRSAQEIDPKDEKIKASVQEVFQRMGYHRIRGNWEPAGPGGKAAADPQSIASGDDPYMGQTPAEVRAQLGRPEKVCRVASQGRVSIQWIYRSSKGMQYIDFLQRAGDPQPTVIGRYTSR